MKYYKISLPKNAKGELQYPGGVAVYEAEIGNFAVDHLYYDENFETFLLLIIPDKVTGIVRPGVEEITEVEAKAISEAHENRVEKVTDEVKLRRLELKAAIGQVLTVEELDAIDITKPDSIFSETKILSDRIDDLK